MIEQQYFRIVIFSLWFLLPLIPAYILYKYLPKNQVAVKGPFKGLTVDMAGAFAGYFLLFLASYIIVRGLIFEKKPEYEVWTVKGSVFDERGRRIDINRHKPSVTVLPPAGITNGVFDFQIPVKVDKNSYDFPMISIVANSLDTSRDALTVSSEANDDFFDLDIVKGKANGNWQYDYDRRVIKYSKQIRLAKASAENNVYVKVVSNDSNYVEIDSVDHR